MAINWDGRGVFVAMHGGSRRIGPSNEAVTGSADGKMDGVDEGKDGGGAAAAPAPLCAATLLLSQQQQCSFASVVPSPGTAAGKPCSCCCGGQDVSHSSSNTVDATLSGNIMQIFVDHINN